MKPQVTSPADLGVADGDLAPRIQMIRQFVPTVQGNCEFIEGSSPAEQAENLIARLSQATDKLVEAEIAITDP